MGVEKYAFIMQMYVYIEYCPETLTGTAFSIKNMLKT